jgi:hypothetical protein
MKKLLPVLMPLCMAVFSCNMFGEEDTDPPHFEIIFNNSILAKTAWTDGTLEILFIDDTWLSWAASYSPGAWDEMRYIPRRYYIIDSTLIVTSMSEYGIRMAGSNLELTPASGSPSLLAPAAFPDFYSRTITADMLIGTWTDPYGYTTLVFTSGHLRWTYNDGMGSVSVQYDGAYRVADNQLLLENDWLLYQIIMPDNNTCILVMQSDSYSIMGTKYLRVP